MANPAQDFMVLSDPIRTDPYVITKACNNLQRMFDEGNLQPLPDWEGDVVEGWKDMLGLNGRQIKQRRPAGLVR